MALILSFTRAVELRTVRQASETLRAEANARAIKSAGLTKKVRARLARAMVVSQRAAGAL